MRDDSAVSQILGRELNDVRLRASVDILLKFINLMWHLRSLQLAKFWKMIPKALFENGDQLVVSTVDKYFFTQFANILWWKVWKCFMLYSDIRLPALRSAHIRHHYCNNIANTLKMVEMSVGFLNFDIIIPTRQWFEKIENVWKCLISKLVGLYLHLHLQLRHVSKLAEMVIWNRFLNCELLIGHFDIKNEESYLAQTASVMPSRVPWPHLPCSEFLTLKFLAEEIDIYIFCHLLADKTPLWPIV